MKKYYVKITYNAENVVQVYKLNSENSYDLELMIPLKKDSESIILAEIINDEYIVIANESAWVRIFNIKDASIVYDRKYNSRRREAGVKISNDNTELYICYRDEVERVTMFEVFSLTSFTKQLVISFDRKLKEEYFSLGSNDRLLFYHKNEEELTHGFFELDKNTISIKYSTLDHIPCIGFDDFTPKLAKDFGLFPVFDKIEYTKNAEGKHLFTIKLMKFDLMNFKTVAYVEAIQISEDLVDCFDYTSEELTAHLLSEDTSSEEYLEEVAEFITSNLYSIVFDENNTIWLGFRGGVVRRVTVDGVLSPLLVTYAMPNCLTVEPFGYTLFHSKIKKITKDEIILWEHVDQYKMNYTEEELNSDVAIIPKKIEFYKPLLNQSKESNTVLDELDSVVIKIEDLNKDASRLKALDEMICLTQDLDEIHKGGILKFRVKDTNGFEDEDMFYKNTIAIKDAEEKIAQIVSGFVEYKGDNSFAFDEEANSFSHAVLALITQDLKHLDLVVNFLSKVDFEHDVFNVSNVLPTMMDKYHKTHGEDILKAFRKVEGAQYWLETYEESL